MTIEENKSNPLKDFFSHTNITQTEFAKTIGVSQGLIGQWLRNDRPISVAKSLEIETAFKIDAAQLCNDVKLVRNHKRVRFSKRVRAAK
ncbi:MAG: helix-turn-helix transcriptional regulator [Methylococcales bacterium]|nr:helix-turn-helix transcriptional regulator [Methylococcales bacterium]